MLGKTVAEQEAYDSLLYYCLPDCVFGAVMGYNLTRRYDSDYYSFINFKYEEFQIGIPKLSYNPFVKEYKIKLFEWWL